MTSVTAQGLINPAVLAPDGSALVNGNGAAGSSTSGGGSNVGAIVGGVLGGVLGLVSLLVLFLCLRSRARRQRDTYYSSQGHGHGFYLGKEEAEVKAGVEEFR